MDKAKTIDLTRLYIQNIKTAGVFQSYTHQTYKKKSRIKTLAIHFIQNQEVEFLQNTPIPPSTTPNVSDNVTCISIIK